MKVQYVHLPTRSDSIVCSWLWSPNTTSSLVSQTAMSSTLNWTTSPSSVTYLDREVLPVSLLIGRNCEVTAGLGGN